MKINFKMDWTQFFLLNHDSKWLDSSLSHLSVMA